MSNRIMNVLFLCTGNSARSIMAETILNSVGASRFRAYSAGSHPAGSVNPIAINWLKKNRFETDNLRSKSWDEFALADAPHMDLVITVCDNAAGEVCPYWPGQPATAHWGYEDQSAGEGSEDEKRIAFLKTLHMIRRRLEIFIHLPVASLSKMALQQSARELAKP